MRFIFTFILCLLFLPVAHAQTKPILQLEDKLDLGGWKQDAITAHKFVADDNMLLLLTRKTIRRFDIVSGKFLEPIQLANENPNTAVISPDGHKLLVLGDYKVKRPAAIWDLRTNKQIAVLDKNTTPIVYGVWSQNGKTLLTSSKREFSGAEICFWDGETFEYQSSLRPQKITWWHLTNDGSRIFFTTGRSYVVNITHVLILIKPIVDPGGSINVWNTRSGTAEKPISITEPGVERTISDINVSPDDKFLTFVSRVAKRDKKDESGTRLAVWEINRSNFPEYVIKPKYEIKPPDKMSEVDPITFSPDGMFFALSCIDYSLRIYETSTGEKRSELLNKFSAPRLWFDDDEVLLFDYPDNAFFAVRAATGEELYRTSLHYRGESETYNYHRLTKTWDTEWIRVPDPTQISVNPRHNLLLTRDEQSVQVRDSLTGEVLQTVVAPPKDYSGGTLALETDWSSDGKTLLIIGADGSTASVWKLIGN